MKRLVGAIVIIYSLVGVFFISACFSQDSDAKNIFKERLFKYLTVPSSIDFPTSEEQRIAAKNLLKFYDEFPNSRFADDARFITLVTKSRFATEEDITAMERLIEKYE